MRHVRRIRPPLLSRLRTPGTEGSPLGDKGKKSDCTLPVSVGFGGGGGVGSTARANGRQFILKEFRLERKLPKNPHSLPVPNTHCSRPIPPDNGSKKEQRAAQKRAAHGDQLRSMVRSINQTTVREVISSIGHAPVESEARIRFFRRRVTLYQRPPKLEWNTAAKLVFVPVRMGERLV